MYCNKCNSSLKDGDHICPNCGFDNDATIDLSQVVRKLSKKEEKRSKLVIITILFLFLSLGIVIIYLINGNKEEAIPITTTPTTTTVEVKELAKLTFDGIILEYSKELFTKKDSTLLLNSNNDINIEFNNITSEEYNNEINGNECLDYKLNELLVKTYAGDNFYSYIFMLNNKYYNITVNYIDDPSIYTETIQLGINQVLNTIKQK